MTDDPLTAARALVRSEHPNHASDYLRQILRVALVIHDYLTAPAPVVEVQPAAPPPRKTTPRKSATRSRRGA